MRDGMTFRVESGSSLHGGGTRLVAVDDATVTIVGQAARDLLGPDHPAIRTGDSSTARIIAERSRRFRGRQGLR